MKIKVKKSVKKKEQNVLKNLAYEYAQRAREIDAFKKRHSGVFNKLNDLITELEGVEIRLKEEARKNAVEGQTVDLLDDDMISVRVVSAKAAVTYDVEKAKKLLPDSMFEKITLSVVSPKIVQELADAGQLDDNLVKKFQNEPEFRTPAVYIKPRLD